MTLPKMTYGALPGIDLPLSRLIMGTMVCAPSNMPYVHELLDHFVSVGGNCLDTARVYGTEAAIGQWLTETGKRRDIVLIGKGVHHDAHGPRVHPHRALKRI